MNFRRALFALASLCIASTATAQLVVPAGSSFALGGGDVDLASSGVQVGGLLSVAGGRILDAANVAILAGGTLDGGSGQIVLSGDWSNAGNFIPGSGSVNFVDGGAPSQIGGSTGFANLSFVTASGKNYVFAAGSTQTIAGLLTIAGTAAQPIQFRSSAAGQVANINLLAGGSQSIVHVGVSDVHATGQHLAPNLSNEGGSGNATGWFAAIVAQTAIPATALSPIGLLLFALALLAVVWHSRRYRFNS
ncbi:hypothetical protein [Rudaea sp.]|uniref:hypothetical protein n=1 Tax=Rudaea sp. TaxID=2136325 RepID=UPI002ED5C71F